MLAMSRSARLCCTTSVILGLISVFAIKALAQESGKSAATLPAARQATAVGATTLDALLAKNDYNGVIKALGQTPAQLRADWLSSRLLRGESVFLAFPYINALWLSGEAQKVADPKTDQRVSAGLILFYAYQVIVVDGARCEDQSAPANRRTQLLTGFRPVFKYLATQSADIQKTVLNTSTKMEEKIAAARRNDHFLCSGGVAETTAILEQTRPGATVGDLLKEAQGSGKIVMPSATVPLPKFIALGSFEPQQAKMREQLQATMPQFFK
jgi:hypothetical protein